MTHWPTTFDLDPAEPRACGDCGWTGRTDESYELFEELLELRCPKCDSRLVGGFFMFPTVEETREAAAAGNAQAIEDLESAERMEARWKLIAETELYDPDDLSDVPGRGKFVVTWDLVTDREERFVVLRVGDQELFRELATWECLPRFEAIAQLLRARYRTRVTGLVPDPGEALTYILGDRLGWLHGVERVNKEVFGVSSANPPRGRTVDLSASIRSLLHRWRR